MVVTSEALGAWRTGLAGYRPKCLIKQTWVFSLDLKGILTNCVRPVRYERSQVSGVPVIPNSDCRRSTSMQYQVVAGASCSTSKINSETFSFFLSFGFLNLTLK